MGELRAVSEADCVPDILTRDWGVTVAGGGGAGGYRSAAGPGDTERPLHTYRLEGETRQNRYLDIKKAPQTLPTTQMELMFQKNNFMQFRRSKTEKKENCRLDYD